MIKENVTIADSFRPTSLFAGGIFEKTLSGGMSNFPLLGGVMRT